MQNKQKNPSAVALGSIKSAKKSRSSKINGQNNERPHFIKIAFFEKNFPYKLINNEWKDKFVIGLTPGGRDATYNPDYFCPELNCYIELTTSKPNMTEQGWKWSEAMRRGLKLRIYWWEGEEVTDMFGGEEVDQRRS